MCDPILVTLLKMQTHYSQSSRENATPSGRGSSLLASYREVAPPPLARGNFLKDVPGSRPVLRALNDVFFSSCK